MLRRFRRSLIWLAAHVLPRGPVRTYTLWSLGMPPIAGAEDPPADPPKNDPPADPPADPPKTFTEDDVERIVRERLHRDRKDRPSDDELRQMREAAQKLKDIEDQNKDELTKAQERIQQLEGQSTSSVEKANRILRRAELIAQAAKQGAADTDAVVALLESDQYKAELDKVTIGDDGRVTGAEGIVKDLLEAKKFLVGDGTTPTPGPGDGGANREPTSDLTAEQLRGMTPQEVAKLDPAVVNKALQPGG